MKTVVNLVISSTEALKMKFISHLRGQTSLNLMIFVIQTIILLLSSNASRHTINTLMHVLIE